MMEYHPVKDGPLRMSRTIDSRQAGNSIVDYKSPLDSLSLFGKYLDAIIVHINDIYITGITDSYANWNSKLSVSCAK